MSDLMKYSGYKWVGDIPVSWNTKRIKYIATLKGRIGLQGLTSDEYQEEGACLITGTDFVNGKINWDSCVHVPLKRWEEASEIQIENGDLLITKDGTVGKVAMVSEITEKTSLNSGVLRIMPKKEYDKKYLFWVLQSNVFWDWFNYKNAGNSTILHLYQNDFNEFIYAFPDLKEQQAIAKFLDKRCNQIDEIISDLENQLEKLNNYKKSIISECVTKGLDKKIEFKYSGIEWIGDIPHNWEVKKIKYCVSYLGSGSTPTSDNIDYYDNGNINWIQSGDLYKKDVIEDTETKITNIALRDISALHVLNAPYIVIAMYGASVGNTSISMIDACSNQACCSIKTNSNSDLRYLYYWFLYAKDVLISKSVGGGQPNISQQIIKNLECLVPPIEEQRNVARYIDVKLSIVNKIVKEKNIQLATIKTHKQSLIYEYVTGKKRVKVGE